MVQKGAIIKVDFDAFTSEGDLFDTTSKETAKEHNQVNEQATYEPMPVIVGVGRVIPGFDQALQDAEPGQEVEVEIPPEEAFGDKDPEKIETVSLREFQKQDVHPHPGMRVTYQQKQGTVVAVTAGRVRLDFNPPLAGKNLKYKFTIREVLEDPEQKVRALIDLSYGMGKQDGFGVTVDGDTAELKLPDSCKYDQRWFVAKYRLVSDLRQYADMKTTRFIEEYLTEEPEAPEAGAGEAEGAEPAAEEKAAE